MSKTNSKPRFTSDRKKIGILDAIVLATGVNRRTAACQLRRLKTKFVALKAEIIEVHLDASSTAKTAVADSFLLNKILMALPGKKALEKRMEMMDVMFGNAGEKKYFNESSEILMNCNSSSSDKQASKVPLPQNQEPQKKRRRQYIPMILRAKLWMKKYGDGMCKQICSQCNFTEITPFNFHVGHIVSVKNGGSWEEENLLVLCPGCNLSNGSGNQENFKNLYFPGKKENEQVIVRFVASQSAMIRY